MAHATSLGRTVAASGMCAAWPGRTFRFTIGATAALTITIADQLPRPHLAAASDISDASGGRAAVPIAETESPEHWLCTDSSADSRVADTNRFYLLLSELARRVGGSRMLRDCTGGQDWPRHGVYFFFEDGELRAAGGVLNGSP